MDNLYPQEEFKILKRHENKGIKFLRSTELKTKTLIEEDLFLICDYQQGEIGNCGLISALATLSQRPEFPTEIFPFIDHTDGGTTLHFNMFYEGKPKTVAVDDALPFTSKKSLIYARSVRRKKLYKPSSDLKYCPSFLASILNYAFVKMFGESFSPVETRPMLNNMLCLAPFFEKVFVKQACNNSYRFSVGTRPLFVFLSFSDCMTSYYYFGIKNRKQNLMNDLKFEIDNKSSVVLCMCPSVNCKDEQLSYSFHAYAVIDYNNEYKAIKLYDQRCCPELCISNEKLPFSLTSNADPNEGKLWISMDQLEKRMVTISSLHSKNMYKSVFNIKRKIKPSAFYKKNFVCLDACKVSIKETSTLMINLFSYSHTFKEFKLVVKKETKDGKKQIIKLKYELPNVLYPRVSSGTARRDHNGEVKQEYFQRFKLQPNTYIFSTTMKSVKEDHNLLCVKTVNFQLKIGCVSECTFEELKCKTLNRFAVF